MTAYYNENEPFAAAWLRELIARNLIAPGDVDERSIEDVTPNDVRGYTQCHFFAGVGVWSYALRLAGWPDDRPVWTGSCPCPPFSSAGKKKACPGCGGTNPIPCPRRTGHFICCLCGHAWLADGRHLWPEFWRLIRDGRPDVVFGEQVASEDGRTWLDIVRASLEIMAYRLGYQDTCASGVGAPHIRQRLYWVANTAGEQRDTRRIGTAGSQPGTIERLARSRADGGLAHHHHHQGLEGRRQSGGECTTERAAGSGSMAGGVEHGASDGWIERRSESSGRGTTGRQFSWMAEPDGTGRGSRGASAAPAGYGNTTRSTGSAYQPEPAGPINSFWRDADWLFCRDERWRPVEPGTFPLAHGVAARVGRLRGYGNAINAEAARHFIEVYLETEGTR